MSRVEDWTSIGHELGKELLVRAWTPGDGLNCAHATKQRYTPCGPPVAVMMTVDPHGSWDRISRSWTENRTKRVICAGHLAGKFALDPGQARLRAEKEAREEVVAAHWRQYQVAYKKRFESCKAEQLNQIPEFVRAALGDIDWDADDPDTKAADK